MIRARAKSQLKFLFSLPPLERTKASKILDTSIHVKWGTKQASKPSIPFAISKQIKWLLGKQLLFRLFNPYVSFLSFSLFFSLYLFYLPSLSLCSIFHLSLPVLLNDEKSVDGELRILTGGLRKKCCG